MIAAWLKLQQIRLPSLFRTLPKKLVYSTSECNKQQLGVQVEVQHVRKYYQYAQVRSPRQLGTNQVKGSQHATSLQRQLLRQLPKMESNGNVAQWPPHLEAKAQVNIYDLMQMYSTTESWPPVLKESQMLVL